MSKRIKNESPNESPKALMVRLPPELHAAVKTLADDERRSLNSQFIILVELGLKQLARGEAARLEKTKQLSRE